MSPPRPLRPGQPDPAADPTASEDAPASPAEQPTVVEAPAVVTAPTSDPAPTPPPSPADAGAPPPEAPPVGATQTDVVAIDPTSDLDAQEVRGEWSPPVGVKPLADVAAERAQAFIPSTPTEEA